MRVRRKRVGDPNGNFWCRVAHYGSDFWEWVDRRQIDAHCYSLLILWGTVRITTWCMSYASSHPDKSGLEVAAVIAAVMAPWSALQAAAIKFLFDARTTSFQPNK
jgi:hypothetical protein